MNLNDLVSSILNSDSSISQSKEQAVLVPANDLIKLQKGYIEFLESKLNAPSQEALNSLAKMAEKVNRDALMKLADNIKKAIETDDKEALTNIENEIRKRAFGPPDSEGI